MFSGAFWTDDDDCDDEAQDAAFRLSVALFEPVSAAQRFLHLNVCS